MKRISVSTVATLYTKTSDMYPIVLVGVVVIVVLLFLAVLFGCLCFFYFKNKRKKVEQEEDLKVYDNGVSVSHSDVCTVTLMGYKDVQIIQGEEFIAPLHTKEGYSFGGWFYDSACTEPYKNIGITKNITLYPKWTKDN